VRSAGRNRNQTAAMQNLGQYDHCDGGRKRMGKLAKKTATVIRMTNGCMKEKQQQCGCGDQSRNTDQHDTSSLHA
jgi:hypothetical protein